MPPPREGFKRPNPLTALEEGGELTATRITKVEHPAFEPNGTRGVFHFDEVPAAVSYDIWVSMEPDGTGGILLGKGVKKSEVEIRGIRPNTSFYAFIVYQDESGKASQPSPAFPFALDSQFGNR